MNHYTLVNNGCGYSDYGIEGIIISKRKEDAAKIPDVITEALKEYQSLYHAAQKAYEADRGAVVKYPVRQTILAKYCKENNMQYLWNLDEVSFDY